MSVTHTPDESPLWLARSVALQSATVITNEELTTLGEDDRGDSAERAALRWVCTLLALACNRESNVIFIEAAQGHIDDDLTGMFARDYMSWIGYGLTPLCYGYAYDCAHVGNFSNGHCFYHQTPASIDVDSLDDGIGQVRFVAASVDAGARTFRAAACMRVAQLVLSRMQPFVEDDGDAKVTLVGLRYTYSFLTLVAERETLYEAIETAGGRVDGQVSARFYQWHLAAAQFGLSPMSPAGADLRHLIEQIEETATPGLSGAQERQVLYGEIDRDLRRVDDLLESTR